MMTHAETQRMSSADTANNMRYRQRFLWRERSLPEGPRLTVSGSVERSEIERGPRLLGTANLNVSTKDHPGFNQFSILIG